MWSTNSSDSDEEETDYGAGLAVEDDKHVEKREERVTITSLKVHKALLKAKSEAYVPQMVSLGPYHHNSLKEDVMDSYKLNSAKDATKDKPTLFDYFLDHVKEMASDFEEFYKIEIDDQTEFARIMMMDGFFLYQVLINEHHDPHQSEVSQRNNETHPIEVSSIKCDIVKLENQIPLFLLFEIDSTLHNKTLGSCLNSHIPHLSCFQLYNDLNIDYVDEPHLLACLHKYISSFLQTNNPKAEEEDKPRDRTGFGRALDNKVAAAFGFIFPHPVKQGHGDFVDRYNAKELAKVGIKFKSLAKVSCKLKFDKLSNTLFLPKIVISETYTEVLMRNLLALEFNDPNRPKNVTQYVELMSCLINTAEDVILLRKRNIIDGHSMRTTDEYVVKMWEGLAKTLLFCEFVEEPQVIKAAISETLIKNYYKRKIRNWWDMHVCKPFRF